MCMSLRLLLELFILATTDAEIQGNLRIEMSIKTNLILTAAFFLSCNVFAERLASDNESHVDDSRIQHRSYTFPPTGESIPYALFVPSNYNEIDQAPLII